MKQQQPHVVAGWVAVPFILLLVFDGLWKTPLLKISLLWFWAYDFLKWVVVPAVSLFVLHRLTRISPRQYGLSAEFGIADVVILSALPLITLFFLHFLVFTFVDRAIDHDTSYFYHYDVLKPLGKLWAVGTLYMSAAAELCESLFFIGLPWLWFNRESAATRYQSLSFAFVTACLFATGHLENGIPNASGAFVFQLLAVWWYLKLRTLWPVIIAHFLIDVVWFWPK